MDETESIGEGKVGHLAACEMVTTFEIVELCLYDNPPLQFYFSLHWNQYSQ